MSSGWMGVWPREQVVLPSGGGSCELSVCGDLVGGSGLGLVEVLYGYECGMACGGCSEQWNAWCDEPF